MRMFAQGVAFLVMFFVVLAVDFDSVIDDNCKSILQFIKEHWCGPVSPL